MRPQLPCCRMLRLTMSPADRASDALAKHIIICISLPATMGLHVGSRVGVKRDAAWQPLISLALSLACG